MEHKISEPNARVDVADVLRGLAVMGIIILHSIEHFNFYSFPDTVPCEWMKFTDKAIWNGLFFVFSNKAYAIFALLFGFSFYIQDNNQQRRGKDFRLRFIWRMALLFIIGQFNAAFFTGEILTMYAMLGLILPLSCRLSDRSEVAGQIMLDFGGTYSVKVSIGQFYGIEINDFAVTVAKTALWISEEQMIRETQEILHSKIDFLPLKSYANIVQGNALKIKWEDVVTSDRKTHV